MGVVSEDRQWWGLRDMQGTFRSERGGGYRTVRMTSSKSSSKLTHHQPPGQDSGWHDIWQPQNIVWVVPRGLEDCLLCKEKRMASQETWSASFRQRQGFRHRWDQGWKPTGGMDDAPKKWWIVHVHTLRQHERLPTGADR